MEKVALATGSLGIVIRAGPAANEDNGIKVFDSFPKPGVQKLIVNSIVAISTGRQEDWDAIEQ